MLDYDDIKWIEPLWFSGIVSSNQKCRYCRFKPTYEQLQYPMQWFLAMIYRHFTENHPEELIIHRLAKEPN